MIIHTPESNVQTSGKMRTAGFNMKASAKGFRIISTTLYKDPILAIVREITCNAWDAHQMNGNVDTPIEVHLPNRLEPWFSVKDFGCGMSDDDIFGVYTTVFDSTKDNSNDVIGAMGLGSKTPFSYNNGQSFTVKSVKDGKKAVYSAYLDRGEPAITCMSEPADTDEADGVEVIVPVRSEDFSRFVQAAQGVMPFFKAPEVDTNTPLESRDFTHMDGYFTEVRSYYGSSNVYAVMGNVCYPLNSGYINQINTVRSYFKQCDVFIEFDIGELDVSASREELHYDDRTIGNINQRVDKIIVEFERETQKWVNDQKFKNIGHAWRKCNERFNGSIRKNLLFEGELIETYATKLVSTFYVDERNGIYNKTLCLIPDCVNKDGIKRITSDRSVSDILNPSVDYEANPIYVIEDDMKVGGVGIAKEYVRQTRKSVYYHHDSKPTTVGTLALLKDRLRDCEYVVLKTSELKENYKPAKKKVVKKVVKPTIQVYRVTIDQDGYRKVQPAEIDRTKLRTENVHYVSMYRDCIERKIGDDYGINQYEGYSLIETIMQIKNIDEVFVIRRTEIGNIQSNDNAVNLFDIKFNKRELRSKIDWKSVTIDAYARRTFRNLTRDIHEIWQSDVVREAFGFKRESNVSNLDIKNLAGYFKVVSEVYEEQKAKHKTKLLQHQTNPRWRLLWNLVGKYSEDDDVQELITLLRGKRNGKVANRN